jgi:hypothetical protein
MGKASKLTKNEGLLSQIGIMKLCQLKRNNKEATKIFVFMVRYENLR